MPKHEDKKDITNNDQDKRNTKKKIHETLTKLQTAYCTPTIMQLVIKKKNVLYVLIHQYIAGKKLFLINANKT